MDEVLVPRPAAGWSYRNLVERIHAIANLGLQSVGIMRQKMSADMEERIRNCNSNEELRKTIERNEELKPALENSLSVPIDLLNSVFVKLSLKDKRFQTLSPCTNEELKNYHLPNNRLHENISKLKKKEHLKTFPKFNEFLCTNTTRRTYYFHVFKCSTDDYPFHFPVKGKEKIESFGDPIPYNDDEGNKHYHQGEDPEEKFIPSKLENLPKGVTVSLSKTKRLLDIPLLNTQIYGTQSVKYNCIKGSNNFTKNFPNLLPHQCTYTLVKEQVKIFLISKY